MQSSSKLNARCSLPKFKFFEFQFRLTKFVFLRIWRVWVSTSYRQTFSRIFYLTITGFCSPFAPDTRTFPIASVLINIVQAIHGSICIHQFHCPVSVFRAFLDCMIRLTEILWVMRFNSLGTNRK